MRSISINWLGVEYNENIDDNIELSSLTPVEIREAQNRAVGNFAYYSNLFSDAKDMETQIKLKYTVWYSEKSLPFMVEFQKASAKFIETMIITKYKEEYNSFENKVRRITKVLSKFKVLIDSFNLQLKALDSISFNINAELKSISSAGGDMCDE